MSADLRPGREEDLPRLLTIYNHHGSIGRATFDESEVTIAECRAWFDGYSVTGPYRLLVAVAGGRVLRAMRRAACTGRTRRSGRRWRRVLPAS